MGVFKPNKFFSRDGVIQNLINQSVISNVDTITWVTSATQSVNEGVTKDITLSATSSLGGSITYSIVGGIDQALFSMIDGTTLRLESKNFESPSDDNTNNTYIVIVRATSSASGSADITVTVTVTDVNEQDFFSLTGSNVTGDSPTWSVSVINSSYGTPDNVTFDSGAGYQYLRIANTDQSSSELEVTIETTGGTFTLANNAGLTFSTGDGTNDSTMTFSGSISSINTALNGMVVGSGVTSFIVNIVDGEFNTTDTININHSNGTVEQQLIEFDNVPTDGSWNLGISSNFGDYITINWGAEALDIQNALRSNTPTTNNWGTNLTVTGNYTIGFTITAAKYGNLGNLYYDAASLVFLENMSEYSNGSTGAGWNNHLNAAGAPDGVYTDATLSPSSSSNEIIFTFATLFSSYPVISPTTLEVTLYTGNNSDISDASIKITSNSSNEAKDSTQRWSDVPRLYSNGIWSLNPGDATAWQTLIQSNISVDITATNNEGGYSATAQIDAVQLKIYYNLPVSISLSTIING